MSQDQSFSQDSYEACLRSLVTFYGIHVDMDGLIDGLARESGAVTFEDLKLLADKLDLEYKEITLLFNKLDTLAVPAILIFDDGAGASATRPLLG